MPLFLYQLYLSISLFLFGFDCPLPPLLLPSPSLSSLSLWVSTAPVTSDGRLMFPTSPISSSSFYSSDIENSLARGSKTTSCGSCAPEYSIHHPQYLQWLQKSYHKYFFSLSLLVISKCTLKTRNRGSHWRCT